jgi:hypothetical protein
MTTLVRYGSRDGSEPSTRCCPACAGPLPSARARYCSVACKQRAYRLRRPTPATGDLAALAADLRRRGRLATHTVYECPACETRFLGERRCAECNRFCRSLGLGGACPGCDEPIVLAELLD